MKVQQDEYFTDGSSVIISGKCVFTGEIYVVIAKKSEYLKWQQGEVIQRAMPSLSKDDREFLISGISPKGWKQAFGDE